MNSDQLSNEEMEEMDRIWSDAPVPDPSPAMDRRFYDMLSENVAVASGVKPKYRQIIRWSVAACIVLFIIGWMAGSMLSYPKMHDNQLNELSGEVQDLKESLVLTLLDQPLAGKRIQAINMIGNMRDVDQSVIENLLVTLNHDPNDNVRLLALEKLAEHVEQPQVLEGIIQAIGQQSSPVVLLRLTEILSALKEKRALPELRRILDIPGLNYNLKKEIDEAVETLG